MYEGAKNQIVKTLKKLSVANLGFAVASAPLLQYITAATGSSGKGVAMSGLLLFFGGGTTGARCSATRRKASLAPGAWRDVFTPRNAARFEKAHAPLLRGLGYPPAGDGAPRGAAVETE